MAYQTVTMGQMDSPLFAAQPDAPAFTPPFDRRAWPMGGRLDYWQAPDGWPLRRSRLGPGTRGRMLVLGGRGDMIEKYLEVVHHWAERGWEVTTFDWRGQGGSGRLTDDPLCGHIDDFAQWIADLNALEAEWRANSTGPHVILAHSMGGHLALRALAEGMTQPDALVAVAPMLGINTGPLPHWLSVRIAEMMARSGRAKTAAWKQKESARHRRLRQKRLTHDPARYADEIWWRDHNRDISVGPPSWNWIAQAFASTRALEAGGRLRDITCPTLVLATSADELVSTPDIQRIVAAIPHAALHLYGAEAAHELLRELDPVRLDALARIDGFLDRHTP
jgi:lysophospholipase